MYIALPHVSGVRWTVGLKDKAQTGSDITFFFFSLVCRCIACGGAAGIQCNSLLIRQPTAIAPVSTDGINGCQACHACYSYSLQVLSMQRAAGGTTDLGWCFVDADRPTKTDPAILYENACKLPQSSRHTFRRAFTRVQIIDQWSPLPAVSCHRRFKCRTNEIVA